MTAEIAILNRSAVALAADSLATVQRDGRAKTYNVNKLFALSKHQPVGIMVYGNAELCGVPWETIIKLYRRCLGHKSFDTVSEYTDNIIAWLSSNPGLFPDDVQEFYFSITVAGYYSHRIKPDIDKQVKLETDKNEEISEAHINRIAKKVIAVHHREIHGLNLLDYLPSEFEEEIATQYAKQIDDAQEHVFKNFRVSRTSKRQLTEIATSIFCRDYWLPVGMSGMVVAGFGESETFPVVRTLSTHGVILGRLIYRDDPDNSQDLNQFEINGPSPAAVAPFAQRDVVDAFLGGIDPHFRAVIRSYFSSVIRQWPEIVSNNLPGTDEKSKKDLKSKLDKISEKVLTKLDQSLEDHVLKEHISPLLDVVSVLPIEELAAVAEALVNLTSVKRKMSPDIETVGGPIDVAVVSKGDGFVWINRKHYFDKELNPQFFVNYLKR